MLPEAVIDRQIAGQPAVPLLGVRVGHGVSPLLAQGLNEPLRFAICAGRVGPGVRWTGFPGQVPSLAFEAGYRP